MEKEKKNYKVYEKQKKVVYTLGTLTEAEKEQVKELKEICGYSVVGNPPKSETPHIGSKIIKYWIENESKNRDEDLAEYEKAYHTVNNGKKKEQGVLGVRKWFKGKYPEEYDRLDKDAANYKAIIEEKEEKEKNKDTKKK